MSRDGPNCAPNASTAHTIASTVVVTPFGRPVVPDEYISVSSPSPPASRCGSRGVCRASHSSMATQPGFPAGMPAWENTSRRPS